MLTCDCVKSHKKWRSSGKSESQTPFSVYLVGRGSWCTPDLCLGSSFYKVLLKCFLPNAWFYLQIPGNWIIEGSKNHKPNSVWWEKVPKGVSLCRKVRMSGGLYFSKMAMAIFSGLHVLAAPHQSISPSLKPGQCWWMPWRVECNRSDFELLLRSGPKRYYVSTLFQDAGCWNTATMLWGSPSHAERPHVDIPLRSQLTFSIDRWVRLWAAP